jgi:hypothetical protein
VADINVERRGPSVWPWIIGLLVLALLIWGLVEMFGEGSTAATDSNADSVTTGPPPVAAPPAAPLPPAPATGSPAPGAIGGTGMPPGAPAGTGVAGGTTDGTGATGGT